jgi:hypothetical protein
LSQFGIDGLQEAVYDKASKSRRKGVALGKSILLDKEIKVTVGMVKVAAVRDRIHEVKVM